ncbi:hypothetical protein JMJ56_07460 [Belnapia sp. T18]|uniref:histidine kinase n=1 Tax=Belnapia arida TaxID=2804533 RepID=A0ABS1TZJ3_9PROT|nr:hybrid sensor histidine kinase/response regulator [Belnapia arida]MBL6077836.1 hypothetical protein [Belnapia arida]
MAHTALQQKPDGPGTQTIPPAGGPAPAFSASAGEVFWPLWLASILVPLLLFAGGAWWSWHMVQAEAHDRLKRTLAVAAEHAARAFETQDALLAAAQRASKGMGWDRIRGNAELASFLRDLDERTAGLGAIGMTDPSGRLVQLSAPPFTPPPDDFSDRDYVRAQVDLATAGPFIGRTITARANGLHVIRYSRPRLDQDGRPDGGVLWATIRTGELAPYYDTLLQHPKDAILLVRPDGAVLVRHPAMTGDDGTRLTGWGEDALRQASDPPGRTVLAPGLSPMDGQKRLYALRQLTNVPLVVVYGQHPAGPWSAWTHRVAIIGLVSGGAMAVLFWVTWVTSRRVARQAEVRAAAEARLRGAERLSALGQVTAGVAHDIRNLALSVQGGAKLIRQALARDDRDRASMVAELLDETAGRGASLTERMVRMVRRGQAEASAMATLDPAAAVAGAAVLLKAVIGSRWMVRADPMPPDLPRRVRGDQAELEAALLNLAVNSRDAMPEGGTIRLSVVAERVQQGDEYPAKLAPGLYARIVVIDSGAGIDGEILDRVGQAFFTTKAEGQGTGLGLSSAAAFARTAGGAMRVESPGPGRGTAVTLWLPEAPAEAP